MTGASTTDHEAYTRPSKVCFVTIGATASFDKLLEAVLEKPFLEALHEAGYTNLIVQYGKEGGKAIYDGLTATERDSIMRKMGIDIAGFDFNTKGLGQEMRIAKGDPQTGGEEGVVISHAGGKHTNIISFAGLSADCCIIRLRIYSGCPSDWSASGGCAQYRVASQPPSGAG